MRCIGLIGLIWWTASHICLARKANNRCRWRPTSITTTGAQREAEPSADLIATLAVQAGDQFNLGLETRAPITAPIRYVLRARVFRPSGVQRLDVFAEGSKLVQQKLAHNSLDLPPGTTFRVSGNRLWLPLPKDVLTGATALLVSCDTFHDGKHVDKVAWRLVWVKT